MKLSATENNTLDLLRKALGRSVQLRPGQWEAIDLIVNKRSRLLCVQRTGWGKSWVYFIATRILRDWGHGPTLIVSPLLALMRDQIESAAGLGIRAVTINSSNTSEWAQTIESVVTNQADAVLISPERLANDEFVREVLIPIGQHLGLLVVDEAHCISDWGHDFRPDYKRLVNVLKHMPANIPILGTTATANDRVIQDVLSQFEKMIVQRGPLIRESIGLHAIRLPDAAARFAWLAEHIPKITGTGIVYTLTVRDANDVAAWLKQHNISAEAYHSRIGANDDSVSDEYRLQLERKLKNNEIKLLVATTALGMGFDKPDLGFVIHFQAPDSIVSYYQQVGRAGRAVENAYGILLSGREDAVIHEYFRKTAFPSNQHVQEILKVLAASDGLNVRQIEEKVNISYGQIEKALKFLSVENPAPVVFDSRLWKRTPVRYRLDQEKIQRLTQQRELEWAEVQNYLDTEQCYMRFLARALDDGDAPACGKCSNCVGKPLVPATYSKKLETDANIFLGNLHLELQCRKQIAKGALPTHDFGINIKHALRPQTGRILCRIGSQPWGRMVHEDRHLKGFRDDLIIPMARMIQDSWRPMPAPQWMTCIPSSRPGDPVSHFAKRLANELEIPFVPAVKKVRLNEPQRLQFNRYRQCRNLDGVFSVTDRVLTESVMLFDDFVHTTWTMTVVSALLLAAGSGPVWPVALATMDPGA